ncbi:L,D-transpeptidase [Hamadaea tsunoensis]|uniref:L,D-transpeptidase n=1 Tax=Hamadaea tsunoensis TaxID=53368 RepID=UPI0003FA95DF|nr:Ig-like domain-containing protein [Hamadaea tsunoensis]
MTRPWTRRRALSALGLTGAAVTGLAACTSKSGSPTLVGPSGSAAPSPTEVKNGKATVSITSPKDGADDAPAGLDVVFTAQDASSTKVELVDAEGNAVDGDMHPDGTSWIPAKMLQWGTNYKVTVTATDADGKTTIGTSAFATMAKPSKTVGFSSFLADGQVVGVGMPMIIRLSRAIESGDRAEVQRRLLVTTTPAQEGTWTWYSATELHWRPKEFWQAGTKVFVDVRIGGAPVGGGYFGRSDLTLDCTIGPSLVMTIDDRAKPKVMHVIKDGKTIRTIPVSLGRPTMPSSSGTTVIIEKLANTVFDTMDDPNPANRYKTPIQFAQRLTWGGEFIHAAPWSVSDQGKRNVSHGCVNMSLANAQWLFSQTLIGSPLTVKGTARALQWNNGWTDWDRPWDEYVKGSAIPYAPPAPPSADPSGAPSASPSTTG